MTNSIDQMVNASEKEMNTETLKGIKNFLRAVLRSNKILKIAPEVGTGIHSPGPLFYYGGKKTLTSVLKEEGRVDQYSIGGGYEKGHIEEVHVVFHEDNVEKYIQFESRGNNEIPTLDNKEINEFSRELNSKYVITGGFFYDPDLDILAPRAGSKILEVNKENLENCLKQFFIEPCLKRPNFRCSGDSPEPRIDKE